MRQLIWLVNLLLAAKDYGKIFPGGTFSVIFDIYKVLQKISIWDIAVFAAFLGHTLLLCICDINPDKYLDKLSGQFCNR